MCKHNLVVSCRYVNNLALHDHSQVVTNHTTMAVSTALLFLHDFNTPPPLHWGIVDPLKWLRVAVLIDLLELSL